MDKQLKSWDVQASPQKQILVFDSTATKAVKELQKNAIEWQCHQWHVGGK